MDLEDIKQAVEVVSGLDISHRSRQTKYVVARYVYFEIARGYTVESYEEIGRRVNRNHASVMNAITNTSKKLSGKSHYNRLKRKVLVQLGVISEKDDGIEKLKDENKELRKLLARDDDFMSRIRFLTDEQYEVFKERAEVMLKFVTK